MDVLLNASAFADIATAGPEIAVAGGLRILVALLASPAAAGVQTSAALTLRNLSAANSRIMPAIVAARGTIIPPLVALLKSPLAEAHIAAAHRRCRTLRLIRSSRSRLQQLLERFRA